MKNGKVVLMIDFDGTICENKFPEIGEPKPKAIEVMQALDKSGFKIVIHTCRANPEIAGQEESNRYIKEMEDWLKENKIPYDDVWKGVGKPIGHLYIDDNALPFLGWAVTLEGILTMMKLVKEGKGKIIIPSTEGGK
jgi:hypothetical protein